MPPSVFRHPDGARSGHRGLWTGAVVAGEGNRPGSANTVDNLRPNLSILLLLFFAIDALRASRNGDRRFNRSSTVVSSAMLLPVEKNGPDFHRLAAPARPKS